jgi:hypothetical protein
MTTYISTDLRLLVASRAGFICEYCLILEDDTYLGCEVDHIISEKHGGPTVADNLAYACTFCNRAKGSDIGSLSVTGQFTRFFNPRVDRWTEHFMLVADRIEAKSAIGEATSRILAFNAADRLLERSALTQLKRYPPLAAQRLMA